jgi:SAM-dependent methyltransferase
MQPRPERAKSAPRGLSAGRGFGISGPLASASQEMAATDAVIRRSRLGRAAGAREPFFFDSERLCKSLYREALAGVTRRFWATTFLSSGFWTSSDSSILGANFQMMEQLQGIGVVPRRLFLLHCSAEEEVQRWQDERMLLRKSGDRDELQRFNTRFANLVRNVEDLAAHGCDVKVVHDAAELDRNLPRELAFDPRDSELAIYDDWRFDLFTGGRAGAIASVRCFTPVMTRFASLRDRASEYFALLWSQAQPIAPLLDRIHRAIEHGGSRIDYAPFWLAQYDHGLPEADRTLKLVELASVKTELKRLARWGEIGRYLDVGTCTGRYPINLASAVREDGKILGIDNDLDCVRCGLWNVEQLLPGDPRVLIARRDFCAEDGDLGGPFDLITCMLGTLLHFDPNRSAQPPYADTLQRALRRLAALLTADGLLFFSVWSEEACRDLRMLSIYSEEDKRRLARWTPPRRELEDRLRSAGLDFEPPLDLEGRMDLYRCTRALPAKARPRRRRAVANPSRGDRP